MNFSLSNFLSKNKKINKNKKKIPIGYLYKEAIPTIKPLNKILNLVLFDIKSIERSINKGIKLSG
jgi:hypothetical protein